MIAAEPTAPGKPPRSGVGKLGQMDLKKVKPSGTSNHVISFVSQHISHMYIAYHISVQRS